MNNKSSGAYWLVLFLGGSASGGVLLAGVQSVCVCVWVEK